MLNDKNYQKFTGIYSAIYSVYDENMNAKKDTIKKLVDYQLEKGAKGFYVNGNTGECTVLPVKTKNQILDAVIEANAGRGRIMAHIGAGLFEDVKALLAHANECDIDAVASLPPSLTSYYNTDEIVDYYRYLAENSKHPVYAYITPVLTSSVTAFAERIAQIPNIAGIKMSIPNYYGMQQVISILKKYDMNLLNGPDECLLAGLAMGADGAIGTTYNMVPHIATKIYDSYKAGDMTTALKYQDILNTSVINPCLGGSLAFWKASMTLLGFDMGYTVFPCRMPTEEDLKVFKKKLEDAKFFDLI